MKCPGCFDHEVTSCVCPHCHYDTSLKRSPLVLPHHTPLNNGRYVVGRIIGRPGGFGITYLGWDQRLLTKIAIKEYLPRDLAGRDTDQQTVAAHSHEDAESFSYGLGKFLEEARTLAQLDHPNVVRVRDFFEENGTAYLVMDYYDGLSLSEYLARQPGNKIPEEQAIGVLTPILDGLREVHAKGFLHRDIKPQNIYLTTAKRPILLDFGAARQAMGEKSRSLSVVLSEGYAPIEQYQRSGKQGPWTDVYGAAATLYTMVSGEVPPPAADRLGGQDTLPRLASLSPKVSHAIQAGMASDPTQRTPSVASWHQVLLESQPTAETGTRAGTEHAAPPPKKTPLSKVFCISCGKGNDAANKHCIACGELLNDSRLSEPPPAAVTVSRSETVKAPSSPHKAQVATVICVYCSEGNPETNRCCTSCGKPLREQPHQEQAMDKVGNVIGNWPSMIIFLVIIILGLFAAMSQNNEINQTTDLSENPRYKAPPAPKSERSEATAPVVETAEVRKARQLAQEANSMAVAAASEAENAARQARDAVVKADAARERARSAQQAARRAGQWDGKNRFGVETIGEGGLYEGQFSGGARDYGIYIWENGNRYEGRFINNIRAVGVNTFADGGQYKGQYKNDKVNGYGTYTWPEGGRFEGHWVNETRSIGVMTQVDGSNYKGQWELDLPKGYGLIIWPNGEQYYGGIVNDGTADYGVRIYPDGTRYEGQIKELERHGVGALIGADGTLLRAGRWKDDNFVE